jgi:hypothetical protein
MFKQILRRFTSLAAVLALASGVFVASYSTPAQAQGCVWLGCSGAPCEGCGWCPETGYICGHTSICCY